MVLKCVKCGSEHLVKNGHVFGWQRFKCKDCGYQLTKVSPAGKPLFLKLISHGLYMTGLSMREIASIVGVTAQSVSRWIRKWHPAYLSEMGEKETMYKAAGNNLLDCLELKGKEELLVFSRRLPSGAKFNIVIELPKKSKHLFKPVKNH